MLPTQQRAALDPVQVRSVGDTEPHSLDTRPAVVLPGDEGTLDVVPKDIWADLSAWQQETAADVFEHIEGDV